ncbi:unnamed protein product [Caenorhabditis nigoni]
MLPTHITKEKPNDGSNAFTPNPVPQKLPFVDEEQTSKKQIWYHWFNIRIRQYMTMETFFFISLVVIFYRLQTISNQNNQVIEMVSSMKSQISILGREVATGKLNKERNQFDVNTKPLEQSIADVLKNMKMEPIKDSRESETEELITPPLNLNISISKKEPFRLFNAADYLNGASVDSAHSSNSNLNPLIGFDQSSLVLLDRPQPPADKAWCSNEHNPVLTINLGKYVKPISVSYQHSKWHGPIPSDAPRTFDVVACLDFYCEDWKPLVSNCEYSRFGPSGTEQFCNISSHLDVPLVGKVQLRFRENYGDPEMTCVHLVRVYGETKTPVIIEKKESLESEKTCADLKWYYHNSYFKYNLVNKSCSTLYGNDCCSDCPECCEECLISDYNGTTLIFIVLFTEIGVVLGLVLFIVLSSCYRCFKPDTKRVS